MDEGRGKKKQQRKFVDFLRISRQRENKLKFRQQFRCGPNLHLNLLARVSCFHLLPCFVYSAGSTVRQCSTQPPKDAETPCWAMLGTPTEIGMGYPTFGVTLHGC